MRRFVPEQIPKRHKLLQLGSKPVDFLLPRRCNSWKKVMHIGSSDVIMLLQLHQQSQHSIIHLWNRKRIWWNDQQSRKTICLAHHLVGWRCSSCCCLAINLPQTPSRFFWSYLVDGASAAKWRFVFLVKASSKFYFLQNIISTYESAISPPGWISEAMEDFGLSAIIYLLIVLTTDNTLSL
jgi:hypothetical protein